MSITGSTSSSFETSQQHSNQYSSVYIWITNFTWTIFPFPQNISFSQYANDSVITFAFTAQAYTNGSATIQINLNVCFWYFYIQKSSVNLTTDLTVCPQYITFGTLQPNMYYHFGSDRTYVLSSQQLTHLPEGNYTFFVLPGLKSSTPFLVYDYGANLGVASTSSTTLYNQSVLLVNNSQFETTVTGPNPTTSLVPIPIISINSIFNLGVFAIPVLTIFFILTARMRILRRK